MIAYCGIDCSKCQSYKATQSGNDEELVRAAERLSKIYSTEVKPEYVICDGCKAGDRHSYYCSNSCRMRVCCINNGYDTCIECTGYPCEELQFELDHNPEAKDNLERLRQ